MTAKPTRKRPVRAADESTVKAVPAVESSVTGSPVAEAASAEAEAPAVASVATEGEAKVSRPSGTVQSPGKEGFEALIAAQSHLADAAAEIRFKVLDFAEVSFASAATTTHKLAAAKSLADVLELNRVFAATVLDKFVETSGKIGAIGLDAASKAAKPLTGRLLPSAG